MPTLLELQDAIGRAILHRDSGAAVAEVIGDGLASRARLDVYRNTFLGSLNKALALSFPAVRRLVGAEFFDGTAQLFIEGEPPQSAWLDAYGGGFPEFLAGYPPAASLPYLPSVARLEWAVNVALHAPDTAPLDLARLTHLAPDDQSGLELTPHPAIGLLHADHPVDAVWRAVLAGDETTMAAVDLSAGPVWLLIERRPGGIVDVQRLDDAPWRFLAALCAGVCLQDAIDRTPGLDVAGELAMHLAAGRFIDICRCDHMSRMEEPPA